MITTFERGCVKFPVSTKAREKCYNLQNSAHRKEISPDRIPYAGSNRVVQDEITICRSTFCNNQSVDFGSFCRDSEREKGIGVVAARIISSAKRIRFDPLFFTTCFIIGFFMTYILLGSALF